MDNKVYTYSDLANSGYTGDAFNVFYEYEGGGEVWGHSGEYSDEMDAWFKEEQAALDFAQQHFPRQVLVDMLYNAGEDVEAVSASVEAYTFENGSYDAGDESWFLIVTREELD